MLQRNIYHWKQLHDAPTVLRAQTTRQHQMGQPFGKESSGNILHVDVMPTNKWLRARVAVYADAESYPNSDGTVALVAARGLWYWVVIDVDHTVQVSRKHLCDAVQMLVVIVTGICHKSW